MIIDNCYLERIRQDALNSGNVDWKEKIFNLENIEGACLLSKLKLSSQASSPLLERWIKHRLGFLPAQNETSGDGLYYNKITLLSTTTEIKVSLGTKTNEDYNFVQIRPDHDIDTYLFLTYNMKDNKCLWFDIPSADVYELLPEYGGYAHGTLKVNGKITPGNLFGKGYEYALRPSCNPRQKKKNELWNIMQKYAHDNYNDFIYKYNGE